MGMIVRPSMSGLVVQDADDCTRLHVETDLDAAGLRTALVATESGEPTGDGSVWLDLAVLRSRAQLVAAAPDWAERWAMMISFASDRGWLSDDRRSVRVHVIADTVDSG